MSTPVSSETLSALAFGVIVLYTGSYRPSKNLRDEDPALAARMDEAEATYARYADEFRPRVTALLEGRDSIRPVDPFAEAWMAQALLALDRPSTLKDVLSAADGVGVAMATEDEIAYGFGRLLARGWMRRAGDVFSLTNEGRLALYDLKGPTSHWRDFAALREWLEAHPPSEGASPPHWPEES